ncbi:MAG: hypothetical protein U0361_01540 [Nitrospiraceae bacterium]
MQDGILLYANDGAQVTENRIESQAQAVRFGILTVNCIQTTVHL